MSSDISRNQRHLPEELIFYVFEILLDSPQRSTSVHLLLISKRVYDWALPKFYRSLKISPEDARPWPGGAQRERLIKHATRQSLHLVQNLQCGTARHCHYFSSFRNLKRLALWGRHLFNARQAISLLHLSLEELFIWDRSDLGVFRGTIRYYKGISKWALYESLRKIGSRIFMGEEVIEAFPYLTHILVGGTLEKPDERATNLISLLLVRKSMKCCIFYSWKIGETNSPAHSNGHELAIGLRDSRLVHVQVQQNHLRIRDADPNVDFWEEQAEMWRKAEKAVDENINSKVRYMFCGWCSVG
ncbi:hypothetical protein DL96DRAFT_539353 [Flagelloscypha sp. PMI_526]|nr:hypothetical protein DL96DRAFT_539353 [Flagelloscypha sp. PMI_526]